MVLKGTTIDGDNLKVKLSIWQMIGIWSAIFIPVGGYVVRQEVFKAQTEQNDIQCKAVQKAFMNCFWELKVNPYKYLPDEGVVRGGTSSVDIPMKHEKELTLKFN